MIYGCAPLLNGSAGGEIKVVARDRKVREKSSGVWSVECGIWSIYGKKEEAWSEDLRTERREDKRKI